MACGNAGGTVLVEPKHSGAAEKLFDLGVEVPSVVFQVPGVVSEDGADGLLAALGMEAGAFPLTRLERSKPLGVPLAESMDGGDGTADAEAWRAGSPGEAVEVVVDEGVLVPGSKNGVILGDDDAHPEDEGEFGIGKVAKQNADRPAADVRIGKKCHVELVVLQPDNATVELLNAQRVASEEVQGGHGEEIGEIGFGTGG